MSRLDLLELMIEEEFRGTSKCCAFPDLLSYLVYLTFFLDRPIIHFLPSSALVKRFVDFRLYLILYIHLLHIFTYFVTLLRFILEQERSSDFWPPCCYELDQLQVQSETGGLSHYSSSYLPTTVYWDYVWPSTEKCVWFDISSSIVSCSIPILTANFTFFCSVAASRVASHDRDSYAKYKVVLWLQIQCSIVATTTR